VAVVEVTANDLWFLVSCLIVAVCYVALAILTTSNRERVGVAAAVLALVALVAIAGWLQ
jgi:hypothetical protein